MFVDHVKLHVKSGDGGSGIISFRREKYVPRGGPDGGDGGKGGDVVLVADPGLVTLYDLQLRRNLHARNGRHGSGNKRHGKNGEHIVVSVPLGTIVREGDAILADIRHPGQRFIVAKGGKGGWGNHHFATSRNRTPHKYYPGEDGEERWVDLDLKTIADVGLVGLPNAGKSTLLSRLTAATPKIASYPFTTREPILGVLYKNMDRNATVADIPGLIEGAHQGLGLGDRFLRHIERTRILVHLVAISAHEEDKVEAVWRDYQAVRHELREYSAPLATKPELVTINKIDLVDDPHVLDEIVAGFRERGIEPLTISAREGEGLDLLAARVFEILDELPPEAEPPTPNFFPDLEVEEIEEEGVAFEGEEAEAGKDLEGEYAEEEDE